MNWNIVCYIMISVQFQHNGSQVCVIHEIYNGRLVIDTGLNLTAGQFRPHIDLDNIYQFICSYYDLRTKLCQWVLRRSRRLKLQE